MHRTVKFQGEVKKITPGIDTFAEHHDTVVITLGCGRMVVKMK